MRTLLSFAVLSLAVAGASPAIAQALPSVPAPGNETSIPPDMSAPTAPVAQPQSPPAREMGTAVPSEPTAPVKRTPAPDTDEDASADEAPASEQAPAPAEASAPQPAADAPVAVADVDNELRTTTPEQQRLVNGAPLYNPNVSVHIVQKKHFADEGKHEFAFYPVTVQVNGKFTNHVGSALHYTYHLQENFALQVSTLYNWHSNESGFNLELIDKVREQAQAASSLLLTWGAQAGVEVTPLYGKFAFYDDHLAQFSLIFTGGAGLGGTRHLIRPEVANQVDGETFNVPARFGDTGTRFLGSVGGGFRVQFGDSYAMRFEVRDLVYTARVDRVDGCNLSDFEKLEAARAGNQAFADLQLSGGCQFQKFDGVDPKTKKNYREDIILGRDLVAEPSSDVLNNLSFYAGFSVLF
jgi:outer membrane beta-barrel protein